MTAMLRRLWGPARAPRPQTPAELNRLWATARQDLAVRAETAPPSGTHESARRVS
jgi:hypothetical protein